MAQAQAIREVETDSLSSLEERINRAVELVTSLREENDALQRKLSEAVAERESARAESARATEQARATAQEMDELRSERKQVRTRIEKLLGQMDLLGNA